MTMTKLLSSKLLNNINHIDRHGLIFNDLKDIPNYRNIKPLQNDAYFVIIQCNIKSEYAELYLCIHGYNTLIKHTTNERNCFY